ncbi:membrane protein [Salmonella enterica subsp. enterica]|uniref:Membrane protein n=1 Tax=Salmonella enterica I TaxID=59201 RepID=A0A379WL43_SALET|nr:membrane protein [Salmonella enterica subsp. enterica]
MTEIANQTKSIAIAAKSEQQSQAEARANDALADAVRAQQNVETTRQTAEADRAKQVALIAGGAGCGNQSGRTDRSGKSRERSGRIASRRHHRTGGSNA